MVYIITFTFYYKAVSFFKHDLKLQQDFSPWL